jgi:cytochrome c
VKATFCFIALALFMTSGYGTRADNRDRDMQHWRPPNPDTIQQGPLGNSIRLGRWIFTQTPAYAHAYVGNQLSCSDCHLEAGAACFAAPVVGLPGHGSDGAGVPPVAPPVWGSGAYNDGAGMNGVPNMAAFVQHNMPVNAAGTLSAQDSYDVAAYIHSKPHTAFNQAYARY